MKKLLALILTLLMIFTFSACGDDEAAAKNQTQTETQKVKTEISITKEQVQKIVNSEFTTPKNVIVIIGDGMGPNDITLAEQTLDSVYDFGLVLNQIKHHGLSTTHSANEDITDSAAAATALATGTKTNNGYVGKDPDGNNLKNVTEYAREAGKKIGIVTDDKLSGATPSGFTVHNISRDNTSEIISSVIKTKADVFMGEGYSNVFGPIDSEARNILYNEYIVAEDFKSFDEALKSDPNNKNKFLGIIDKYSSVASDNLALATQTALDRLKNDNGFFLMIESCGTDKFGQNNNINGKLNSVVSLDRTVAAVLKFMEKNPDTLLIVTSDHDTGGVKLPEGDEKLSSLLTTKEHTATPVRVFAVGKGSEYFSGKTVDNTDIAKFLIKAIKGE